MSPFIIGRRKQARTDGNGQENKALLGLRKVGGVGRLGLLQGSGEGKQDTVDKRHELAAYYSKCKDRGRREYL